MSDVLCGKTGMLDLRSESDSDGDQGEFKQSSEFSYQPFSNYFPLKRMPFNEVHNMIQSLIDFDGCNPHKPNG